MILDEIVEKTKLRVEANKQECSLKEIKQLAFKQPIDNSFPFEKAIKDKTISFILEIKKASPSKGEIVKEFDYLKIAKEYQEIGAKAISVLTEPYFFKGNDKYLKTIANNINLPILRKDFIIDEYMIYEAKILGAKAILLICSILDSNTLKKYLKIADSLGLSCLVETHDEFEIIKAMNADARVIGVNNRDLKTFNVDLNNSVKLRKLVNDEIIFVSESGITSREDIKVLEKNNVDAVLIGETLMKTDNRLKELDILRGKYD